MRQKSLFDGTVVSIFCFFCTRSDLSAENSFLFMSILSKDLHPSAAAAPFRSAALPALWAYYSSICFAAAQSARAWAVLIPPATSLHCAKRKPPALFFTLTASGGDGGFSRALKTAHWAVFARRDAKRTGMGCSHPTSNFTTLCKKKTASAFLHADGSGGDGGFSRALKTAHRAVFARRDAKRRARAVLIPPATSLHCAKRKPPALFFTLTALAEMVGFEPTCPVKDKTISSL